MRIGVIDIGSNSVRLFITNGELKGRKFVANTQVAEGLATKGCLSPKPMKRTADAIKKYIELCHAEQVEQIFCFATEAVRSAVNGDEFCRMIADKCGVQVHVLTGEQEAHIGFKAAYTQGNCCVVDIGGASTEIIVGNSGGIVYSKSLPIGIVRIKDICGGNADYMEAYINGFLSGYGNVGDFDEVVMIGGTASTIVSIIERMEPFDEERVHGYVLTKKAVRECYDYVTSVPLEFRNRIEGLPQTKINVICGGMLLVLGIMDMLHIEELKVGCRDNLEGYLMCFADIALQSDQT